MNVLIVDDEPMTRSLLRRVLIREFACTVVEATNGLEALSVAGGATPVDLIVTDLRMPVMDGIELLEALRQFPPLAAVPVVMMSAARESGPVHRAIELGVTDYLLKPLEAVKVAARLRAVVDRLAAPKDAEAARPGGDATTPILFADGNADFRLLFTTTFRQRTIHAVETGVAALQKSAEVKPGIVFVGGELGVLGPELLVRKLRATPDLASARIFAIVGNGSQAPAQVDGVVTRTFVADDFRRQVERVLGVGPKAGGVLAAHPELKAQMATAAEQVFGMMLQLEVTPSFEVEALPVEHLVSALVRFTLTDGGETLTLALRADRETARVVAAGLSAAAAAKAEAEASAGATAGAAGLTPDDAVGAVSEVITIIGGRLRTALESAGVRAAMGRPEPSEGGAGNLSEGGDRGVQVTVKAAEKGLAFVLQLTSTAAVTEAASKPTPTSTPTPTPTPIPTQTQTQTPAPTAPAPGSVPATPEPAAAS